MGRNKPQDKTMSMYTTGPPSHMKKTIVGSQHKAGYPVQVSTVTRRDDLRLLTEMVRGVFGGEDVNVQVCIVHAHPHNLCKTVSTITCTLEEKT